MFENSEKGKWKRFAVIAVVVTVCFGPTIFMWLTRCSYHGCENIKEKGGMYCSYHALSVALFGTPDYDKYRKEHPLVYPGNKPGSSSSSSSKSGSYSSSSSKNKTSSSKSYTNGHAAYDAGYDAIYEDDDYDWDRYQRDPEYANGVDDAMEDFWD